MQINVNGACSCCVPVINYRHNLGDYKLIAKDSLNLPKLGTPFRFSAKKVRVTPPPQAQDVVEKVFLKVIDIKEVGQFNNEKCFAIKKTDHCGSILEYANHNDPDLKFVYNSGEEKKRIQDAVAHSEKAVGCFEKISADGKPIVRVHLSKDKEVE